MGGGGASGGGSWCSSHRGIAAAGYAAYSSATGQDPLGVEDAINKYLLDPLFNSRVAAALERNVSAPVRNTARRTLGLDPIAPQPTAPQVTINIQSYDDQDMLRKIQGYINQGALVVNP